MRVTSQEEYGLRCMMQMAGSGPDQTVSVHEIAAREGLSDAYVAKLMNLLREAGLVDSVRGRSGGYYITHPAESVSLSAIMRALGGRLFQPEYCERFPGEESECVHLGDCSIRSLWGTVEGVVEEVLSRTTLADLLKSEQRVKRDLLGMHRRLLPIVSGPADAGPSIPIMQTDPEDE